MGLFRMVILGAVMMVNLMANYLGMLLLSLRPSLRSGNERPDRVHELVELPLQLWCDPLEQFNDPRHVDLKQSEEDVDQKDRQDRCQNVNHSIQRIGPLIHRMSHQRGDYLFFLVGRYIMDSIIGLINQERFPLKAGEVNL